MLLNLDEFDKVVGEIYKITNIVTNKSYVGQTRSHRLNHGKYRPFGYLSRFRDHISEANSNKQNQSRYLNSSILKHGSENFVCEKILSCKIDELDAHEQQYISEYNTKFPNGYNLTDGGQGGGYRKGCKIVLDNTLLVKPSIDRPPKCLTRTDKTKLLISERVKAAKSDPKHRNQMMVQAQSQHLSKKFEKFRNVTIDENDTDKYIHIIRNNIENYDYIKLSIGNIKTTFVGRFETTDEIKERAKRFISDLLLWQCDQIAGTPLEPSLPLVQGNLDEELG